jgi:hypothetical protein
VHGTLENLTQLVDVFFVQHIYTSHFSKSVLASTCLSSLLVAINHRSHPLLLLVFIFLITAPAFLRKISRKSFMCVDGTRKVKKKRCKLVFHEERREEICRKP